MKKTLGCLLMLLAFQANGQEGTDACATIGGFAHTIMEARQKGAAMSSMMNVVASMDGADKLKEIAKTMVIAAYEEPQYSLKSNKADAATRFRNKMELECYKAT